MNVKNILLIFNPKITQGITLATKRKLSKVHVHMQFWSVYQHISLISNVWGYWHTYIWLMNIYLIMLMNNRCTNYNSEKSSHHDAQTNNKDFIT